MRRIDIAQFSGATLALLAAALFGISTPLAKWLLGEGIDPWLLAGLLYAGSGGGLMITHALQHHDQAKAPLRRTDISRLMWVILSGGVVAPYCSCSDWQALRLHRLPCY